LAEPEALEGLTMGTLVLIAARNLIQHRKRSLLLGLAICSVTVLLVLLSSVSNGIMDTMMRAANTLSTGHVNVGGFFKVTSGMAAPVVTRHAPITALVRKEVPGAMVVDRLRGWGKVISPAGSVQIGIGGVDITAEAGLRKVVSLVKGDLMDLRKPYTALIFQKQAEKLEVTVGDQLTIRATTARGAANAVDVRVVAIARDMGLLSSFSMFTSKDAVRGLYQLDPGATGAIQIYLDDVERAPRVAEKLRGALNAAGYRMMDPQADPFWRKFTIVTREDWTGQKLDVSTWKDEMGMMMWIITAFDTLTVVLVGILLIIIVIGVMNTLWISIRERTREIGTLRAIGMGRAKVLWMFLLEAGILALTSTSAGALLGTIGAAALNAAGIELSPGFVVFLMSDTLRLVVAPGSVLVAICTITVITTLFALYPSYQATRLKPVTAIHHVG